MKNIFNLRVYTITHAVIVGNFTFNVWWRDVSLIILLCRQCSSHIIILLILCYEHDVRPSVRMAVCNVGGLWSHSATKRENEHNDTIVRSAYWLPTCQRRRLRSCYPVSAYTATGSARNRVRSQSYIRMPRLARRCRAISASAEFLVIRLRGSNKYCKMRPYRLATWKANVSVGRSVCWYYSYIFILVLSLFYELHLIQYFNLEVYASH